MSDNIFGVKIVPSRALSKGEMLAISGAKMTHTENLTTGEKKQVMEFIDAVKVKRAKGSKK